MTTRPSMYPNIRNPNQSTSMYPGATTGIDLRREFDDLLYRYGHWIIVRHYDLNTRSEFWDDELHESRGGAPWVYEDHVVRSRKVLETTGGVLSAMEMPSPPGIITVLYVTYYVKWDAAPDGMSMEDELFEFTWSDSRQPEADEARGLVTRKYNILEAVDLLGDSGRREYYKCICKQDVLGW